MNCMILMMVLSLSANAQAVDSLPSDGDFFDVLHYDLSFDVLEDLHLINGTAEIQFMAGENGVDSLILDLVSLRLDSVSSGESELGFRQDKRTVTIFLPDHLEAEDTAYVRLYFSGAPGRNRDRNMEAGFYWDMTFREHPVYMFYAMEPASCRYIFPCRDVIDDKATFSTEITVTDTLTALAPGMLTEMDRAYGRITYTWEMSREMPIYTWGLVISDFTITEDDTYSWIKYYGFEECSKVIDRIYINVDLIVDCFEEIYAPYPWDHNLNFPCTPGYLFGEHNTMPYVCIPLEDYVVHEIAHMWWGNLVTEMDWSEIWLAEGLATYSEALWKEWMYGEKSYRIHIGAIMYSYLESHETAPMVPSEGFLWNSTNYDKGASVMHMLRHVIGDEAFFEGLQTFLEENAYCSVVTEDLRSTFEQTSGTDLDWFFSQWVYQGGLPDYRLSWTSFQDEGLWITHLDIMQVQETGSIFSMPVDIIVHGEDDDSLFIIWNDSEVDYVTFVTDFRPLRLEFDPYRWILRADLFRMQEKKPPETLD